MILVMGIDPGVANTGFGVVRVAGGQLTAVDGGVIESPAETPPETRLARIHAELEQLISWHEPSAVAMAPRLARLIVSRASQVGPKTEQICVGPFLKLFIGYWPWSKITPLKV